MQLAEENAEAYDKAKLQRIVSLCKEHDEEDHVKRQTSRFAHNVQWEGTAELRGIQFRAIDAIYSKSEAGTIQKKIHIFRSSPRTVSKSIN